MIRFVEGIRIYHTEALLDKQYLHECYPSYHHLKKKGWLTLVRKPFFPFARCLMNQIRQSVDTNDEGSRRGNGLIESAVKTLEEKK